MSGTRYALDSAFSLTNKFRSRNGAGLSQSSIARRAGTGEPTVLQLAVFGPSPGGWHGANLSRERHSHRSQIRVAHIATVKPRGQPFGFHREHLQSTLDSELIEKVSQMPMEMPPIIRPGRNLSQRMGSFHNLSQNICWVLRKMRSTIQFTQSWLWQINCRAGLEMRANSECGTVYSCPSEGCRENGWKPRVNRWRTRSMFMRERYTCFFDASTGAQNRKNDHCFPRQIPASGRSLDHPTRWSGHDEQAAVPDVSLAG
ncbi:MAG: hypothetical protein ABI651_04635 [Verrucomicrobiota bacterium]